MRPSSFARTAIERDQSLPNVIGKHPQYYFTWEHGGEFAELTLAEYEKARGIKGISKMRTPREQMRLCWDSFQECKP